MLGGDRYLLMALVDCDLTLPFFSHAHANGDDVSRACIGGGGNRHSQAFEEQLTRPLASCEPDELLRSRAAALSPRGLGTHHRGESAPQDGPLALQITHKLEESGNLRPPASSCFSVVVSTPRAHCRRG